MLRVDEEGGTLPPSFYGGYEQSCVRGRKVGMGIAYIFLPDSAWSRLVAVRSGIGDVVAKT